MAELNQEIGAFREEQQRLSSRVTRNAIVRLFLLAIIVFTFVRAVEKINHNVEIKNLSRTVLYSELEVSQLRSKLDSLDTQITKASVEQLRFEEHSTPGNPADTTLASYQDIKTKNEALRAEFREVASQLDKARGRFEKLSQDYEDSLRREFTLQSSFLGNSLQFDLRFWVYVLPFLFLLAETHYQILRKKLQVLNTIAACHIVKQQNPALIELLFVSKDSHKLTPFTKYPAQLEHISLIAGSILLLGYLLVLGWDYWPGLESWELGQYSQLLLTFCFYCFAYYQYVAGKLNSQAAGLTEQNTDRGWILPFWTKLIRVARHLISRILPKRTSLVTTSLLILISLYLSTAASSCRDPVRGYHLALSHEDAWWLPALSVEYWRGIAQAIGRSAYLLSLVLAILSIFFVLASFKFKRVYESILIRTIMLIVSGSLTLFLILDFSFGVHWIPEIIYPLKITIWLVTLSLWLRFGFSNSDDKRSRWVTIRAILIILYLPLMIDACFLLGDAIQNRIYGIPIYFVSVCLLSLAYLKLMMRSQL